MATEVNEVKEKSLNFLEEIIETSMAKGRHFGNMEMQNQVDVQPSCFNLLTPPPMPSHECSCYSVTKRIHFLPLPWPRVSAHLSISVDLKSGK